MDENTVFDPNIIPTNTPVGPPAQKVEQQVQATPVVLTPAPKLEPVVISEVKTITPPPNSFSPASPPPGGLPPESVSSFGIGAMKGRIIKVLIGLGIFAVLLFVIFVVVLPRINQNNNKNVTLTYWGLWDNDNVMKSIIKDFEKNNPTITVKYEKQDIKQYRERLSTRIQNKTGPDIFKYHNTWLPMMSPFILPLSSDVIKKEDFQKNYYPVIQHDLVRGGAIYGIPAGIDTLALFVNKDIFAAAGLDVPTTWDTFASTSRKLTVKDEQGKIKTAGAAMGTFDNINHAPDIISLLLVQNGANLEDLNSTQQSAVDAINFYSSFTKEEGNVWDSTLDPSLMMFVQGNLAMYFGYSWDVFSLRAANPNLPFEIHPVPYLPNRNISIASYWVNGVSSKGENQKESLLFMKFLAQKETQQKLYAETSKTRFFGDPYARVDMAGLLKENEYVYPFIIQAKDAVSSFFAADTEDNGINTQMNAYLGNSIRSVLNNDSAESAIETLSLGVSQVLSQYGQQ